MDNQKVIDEIAFIKEIISESRKEKFLDNGIGYIFWGVLVTVGLLLTFFNHFFSYHYNDFWFWVPLITVGWVYNITTRIRKKKKKEVKSSGSRAYIGGILGSVWISIGIAITILGFVGPISGAFSGNFISAIISAVLGVGYFISGNIYEMNSFKVFAIFWWIGSIVLFLVPGLYSILIMALMIICFQIVPGIIVFKKYKSTQAGV